MVSKSWVRGSDPLRDPLDQGGKRTNFSFNCFRFSNTVFDFRRILVGAALSVEWIHLLQVALLPSLYLPLPVKETVVLLIYGTVTSMIHWQQLSTMVGIVHVLYNRYGMGYRMEDTPVCTVWLNRKE